LGAVPVRASARPRAGTQGRFLWRPQQRLCTAIRDRACAKDPHVRNAASLRPLQRETRSLPRAPANGTSSPSRNAVRRSCTSPTALPPRTKQREDGGSLNPPTTSTSNRIFYSAEYQHRHRHQTVQRSLVTIQERAGDSLGDVKKRSDALELCASDNYRKSSRACIQIDAP